MIQGNSKSIPIILKRSVVPLILVIGGLIGLSLFTTNQLDHSIERQTIVSIQNSLEARLALLRSFMDSARRESFGLTQDPLALELIQQANENNPEVLNSTAYQEKKRLLENYMNTIMYDSGVYETTFFLDRQGRFLLDASYGAYRSLDYKSMEFYEAAGRGIRLVQDVVWSPFTGKPIMISGNPVYNLNNEIVGSAGIIFKFDVLSQKVVKSDEGSPYRFGILKHDGTLLTPAAPQLPISPSGTQVAEEVLQSIQNAPEGVLTLGAGTTRSLMVIEQIPEKNWYLYGVVPVRAYVDNSLLIKQVVVMILLVCIVIAGAVIFRTAQLKVTNDNYMETLEALQEAQNHLVMTEKLASLGSLVAGLAHEINTPVGNAILSASYLKLRITAVMEALHGNTLKRSELLEFMDSGLETVTGISVSLDRITHLVESFKRIAASQRNEEKELIHFKSFVEELIQSLRPVFHMKNLHFTIDCPEFQSFYSYPGAFSQILTHLIQNSILHGYDEEVPGNIVIRLSETPREMELRYSDDGKGIAPEILSRVFDPFFTTKMSGDRSGLGLNVVFNLVTHVLGGRIHCESTQQAGTEFVIVFPKDVRHAE